MSATNDDSVRIRATIAIPLAGEAPSGHSAAAQEKDGSILVVDEEKPLSFARETQLMREVLK